MTNEQIIKQLEDTRRLIDKCSEATFQASQMLYYLAAELEVKSQTQPVKLEIQ
jgi:hypothetical protein